MNLLARIYRKSKQTIYNWIEKWDKLQTVERSQSATFARKFNDEKKQFIIDLYDKNPTLFLDEAKQFFIETFRQNISLSSVWTIITSAGYSTGDRNVVMLIQVFSMLDCHFKVTPSDLVIN